jgi:hypothetical protein
VTVKNNKTGIILLVVLAFAVIAYFALPLMRGNKISSDGEGLYNLRIESFQVDGSWAYRIYKDSAAIIEQKTVPGIQGNAGFKNENEALKTAALVVEKLNQNIFPPTISKRELDSLKISY